MTLDYYDPEGLSAVFYDLICGVDPTNKGDADYYDSLIKPGAAVLELGCGTGRIAFDLAARGHRVVGIDLSPAMLYRAALRREQLPPDVRERTALAQGDMATVQVVARFDLVAITYFSLAHLPPQRWPDVFSNAKAQLAPGGLVAVHLPLARLMAMQHSKGPDVPVLRTQYSADGDHLELYVVSQSFAGGHFEQVLDYVMRNQSGDEIRRSRERITYFDEDPRPHAAAAGLAPVGEPTELGVGEVFCFREA